MICPDREFRCPYCRPDGSCGCYWCVQHGNDWVMTTSTAIPANQFRNCTEAEVFWMKSRPEQLTLDQEMRRKAQELAQRELEAWPP